MFVYAHCRLFVINIWNKHISIPTPSNGGPSWASCHATDCSKIHNVCTERFLDRRGGGGAPLSVVRSGKAVKLVYSASCNSFLSLVLYAGARKTRRNFPEVPYLQRWRSGWGRREKGGGRGGWAKNIRRGGGNIWQYRNNLTYIYV